MTWSNTAHITQADWDEHQESMKRRRLQERIYNLKQARKEPEVRTVYVDSTEDMMDILQSMLDEREDWIEEDENDKP